MYDYEVMRCYILIVKNQLYMSWVFEEPESLSGRLNDVLHHTIYLQEKHFFKKKQQLLLYIYML